MTAGEGQRRQMVKVATTVVKVEATTEEGRDGNRERSR